MSLNLPSRGFWQRLTVRYLQNSAKRKPDCVENGDFPLTTFVRSDAGIYATHTQIPTSVSCPGNNLNDLSEFVPLAPFTARVEDYHVLKEINKGSSAKLYLGQHVPSGIQVALKLQPKRKRARSTVTKEVSVCAQLDHPNTMRLLAAIEMPDKYVLVCEYLGGMDLLDVVRRESRGLRVDRALRYFWQLVSALGYMHAKGLVHRDIKAENCVLDTEGGSVKFVDFGTSEAIVPGAVYALAGSIPYMAPELVQCLSQYGTDYRRSCSRIDWKAADVWSLALVGVLLFAGRLPWARACPKSSQEYAKYRASGLEHVFWRNVPEKVRNVVVSMLHPDLALRPTIGEVARRVERLLEMPGGNVSA